MEKDIRVAIFEDNYMLRDGYYQLINGMPGYRCVGAFDNANDVIFKVRNCHPDVIVMDIEMPGMTGIEATRLVKNEFPDVQIIMQTVFEDEERIFESIHSGSNGYILKKASPVKLLDAITEAYHGGAPMTPSIASKTLQLFRQNSSSFANSEKTPLTDRQKGILECIEHGMSYKLIAEKFFISVETVRYHVKNIYSTLHVHSRFELLAKKNK